MTTRKLIALALCLPSLPALADEQWPIRWMTGGTSAGSIMMGPRKIGEYKDSKLGLAPDALALRGAGGSRPLMDIRTGGSPSSGFFASADGTFIDYCSVTGCLSGPNLLGGVVGFATSRLDASAQESGFSLNFTAQTGKAETWKPSTAYSVGTQVHGPQEGIYEATIAGTSGASGPTFCPRSTYPACYYTGGADASTGTDGGVTWKFVGASINDGKSGFSNAMRVKPGAGHAWGMNTSMHVEAGVGAVPMFGFEMDTTNDNMDYAVGGPIMANIFLNGAHAYPGTAAVYATMSGPVTTWAWHYGMLFQGDKYVKDATIADATSASSVIHALGAPHTHDVVFRDESTAGTSLRVTGNKSNSAIDTKGMTGTAVALDMADGQVIRWGSYAMYSTGGQLLVGSAGGGSPLFRISATGDLTITGGVLSSSITVGAVRETDSLTIPSSTSGCSKGQHAWDANYEYRCVADNVWKRAALSSW